MNKYCLYLVIYPGNKDIFLLEPLLQMKINYFIYSKQANEVHFKRNDPVYII